MASPLPLALLPSLVTFALAAQVLLIPRARASWAGLLALLGPAALLLSGIALWPRVDATTVELLPLSYLPGLGLDLDLRLDRLGLFFLVLVGGIGLGIFQYSRKYFGAKATRSYWAIMLAFTGAMQGIVLADNLVALYVFWELTTVSSALLVARASDEPLAKKGALQAFIVTALGGLALLTGILLLGHQAGTYSLARLAPRAAELVADPAHRVPLLLMLVGAFTKSAQVPFHFWLPGAMAAPAPVSAYLHSATMVKAGIFLIARLFPLFADSPLWLPILTVVGLTSFLVAGWTALWNDDVKKLLAYSTIAYLGLLVAHFGFSARTGLRGELLTIANHALYKSALFLLVGWVEKATGTRDLRTLARERWPPHEPLGTALFGLGALAMSGTPLLLGFVSKEIFLEGVLGGPNGRLTWPVVGVVVAATAPSVAYALKIFTAMLFGSETPPPGRGGSKRSPWLLAIPALLLLPQVLGGLMPELLRPLLHVGAALPTGPAVWHHLDKLLFISLASFALGGVLFLSWQRLARAHHYPIADLVVGGIARAVLGTAAFVGRLAQAGGLARYNALTFVGAAVAAVAAVRYLTPAAPRPLPTPALDLARALEYVPAVVTAGAAVLVVLMRPRLSKAVMLAIVGYGVAFFYVLFRAPDLVLTQVLVETVSLVLLVLAFRRMPVLSRDRRPAARKALHAVCAVAVGATMAWVAWSAGTLPAIDRTGQVQAALSVPEGHGRNVVNVILVDFRGADTLGEIIVLGIAAFGVVATLRARPERDKGEESA
jgi:NADH:ubiquinone oxidoreductase subunit 5 (subunit L)/multisubunit Na+/H+ antiporter MnhA subunit